MPGCAAHQDWQSPSLFLLDVFWLLLGYGNEGLPHALGGAGVPLCRWDLVQASRLR